MGRKVVESHVGLRCPHRIGKQAATGNQDPRWPSNGRHRLEPCPELQGVMQAAAELENAGSGWNEGIYHG